MRSAGLGAPGPSAAPRRRVKSAAPTYACARHTLAPRIATRVAPPLGDSIDAFVAALKGGPAAATAEEALAATAAADRGAEAPPGALPALLPFLRGEDAGAALAACHALAALARGACVATGPRACRQSGPRC